MTSDEIQKQIDECDYWDAKVSRLECKYFSDEIELAYEHNNDEIIYGFFGCYKSEFNHVKDYDKLRPVRDMTYPQMPYHLHNVEVGKQTENGINFYTFKINMFPLYLEIWCKNIVIKKEAQIM